MHGRSARTQVTANSRDGFDINRSIMRVLPVIAAARGDGERLRSMPTPVAKALGEAGLLQMYLPKALGGPELPPLAAFQAIEEIATADGSIGWCAMIATLFSGFAAWLAPEVGEVLAGRPADMRGAGSIRPQGRAHPVDGGYRIDGHWDFASGIAHARWIMCPCFVMDGGKPMLTPAGTPKVRHFWVPAESVAIQDTWHVMGLRGTGSHDFTVEDVFVPESHTSFNGDSPHYDGLLYNPRLFLTWAWTTTVAHSFGIARSAMNDFSALASAKSTTSSTALLRDRPLVQTRYAEAEAALNAARSYVRDTVGQLWTLAGQDHADLDAAIIQARLAITHGMHAAAKAVDLVFHAAGTNAVYEKNALERHFRDIHVALQHGAALPVNIETAGKALLGVRPTDPGW